MIKQNRSKIVIACVFTLFVVTLVFILFNFLNVSVETPVNAAELYITSTQNTDGTIPTIEGYGVEIDDDPDLKDSTGAPVKRRHFTKDALVNDKGLHLQAFKDKTEFVGVSTDKQLEDALNNNKNTQCIYLLKDVTLNWNGKDIKSSNIILNANFFGNGYKVTIKGVGGVANFTEPVNTNTFNPTEKSGGGAIASANKIVATGLFVGIINPGVKVSTTTFQYRSSMGPVKNHEITPDMLKNPAGNETMAAAGIISGINYGVIGNCVLNVEGLFTFGEDGYSSATETDGHGSAKTISANCSIIGGISGIVGNGGAITRTTVNIADEAQIIAYTRGKGYWNSVLNSVPQLGLSACAIAGGFVGQFVPTNGSFLTKCTLNGKGTIEALVAYATKSTNYHSYAGAFIGTASYFGGDGNKVYSVIPVDIGLNNSKIEGIISSYTGQIIHNYNRPLQDDMKRCLSSYAKLFGYMKNANGIRRMNILFDFESYCNSMSVSNPNMLTTLASTDSEYINGDINVNDLGTFIYPENNKGELYVRNIYDIPDRDLEIIAIADGNKISAEEYKDNINRLYVDYPISKEVDPNQKLGGIIWNYKEIHGNKEQDKIIPFHKKNIEENGIKKEVGIGAVIQRLKPTADAKGIYKFCFGEVVDYNYNKIADKEYDGNTLDMPLLELSSNLGIKYTPSDTQLINNTYSWFYKTKQDNFAKENRLSNLNDTIMPTDYSFYVKAGGIFGNTEGENLAYYDNDKRILAYNNDKRLLVSVKPTTIDIKNIDGSDVKNNEWIKDLSVKLKMGQNLVNGSGYDKLVLEKGNEKIDIPLLNVEGKPISDIIYTEKKSSKTKEGESYLFKAYKTGYANPVAVSKSYNIKIDKSAPILVNEEYFKINGNELIPIRDINTIEYTNMPIRVVFEIEDELSGLKTGNVDYVVQENGAWEITYDLTGENNNKFTFTDDVGNSYTFTIDVNIDIVTPTIQLTTTDGENNPDENGVYNNPFQFTATYEIGKSGYDLYITEYYSEKTSSTGQTTKADIAKLSDDKWKLFKRNMSLSGQEKLTVDFSIKNKEIWFKLVNTQLDEEGNPLHDAVIVQLENKLNQKNNTFIIDLTLANLYITLDNIMLIDSNISLQQLIDDSATDNLKKQQLEQIFNVAYTGNNKINLSDKLTVVLKDVEEFNYNAYRGYGSICYNANSKIYDVNTREGYDIWGIYDKKDASIDGKIDKKVKITVEPKQEKIATKDAQNMNAEPELLDYTMSFPIHILKDDDNLAAYYKEDIKLVESVVSELNGTLKREIPSKYLDSDNIISLGRIGSISKADREIKEFNEYFENDSENQNPNTIYTYGDELIRELPNIELSDGSTISFNIVIKQFGKEVKDKILSAGTYEITLNKIGDNPNYNFIWQPVTVTIHKKEVDVIPIYNGSIENVPVSIKYDGVEHYFDGYILDKKPVNVSYEMITADKNIPVTYIKDVGKYIIKYSLDEKIAQNNNYQITNPIYNFKVTVGKLSINTETLEEEYTGSSIVYPIEIDLEDENIKQDIGKKSFKINYYRYNTDKNTKYDPISKTMVKGSTYDSTVLESVKDVGYYYVEIIFDGYKNALQQNNFLALKYSALLVINKAETIINAVNISIPYDGEKHAFNINDTYVNIYGKSTNVKVAGMNKEKFPINNKYTKPEIVPEDGYDILTSMLTIQYENNLHNYVDFNPKKEEGQYSEIGEYSYKLIFKENENYYGSVYIVRLNIVKATMEKIVMENNSVNYDGQEHFLSIKDLPKGSTISYHLIENNKIVDTQPTPIKKTHTGKYIMSATISMPNYNDLMVEPALLEIKEIDMGNDIQIVAPNVTYNGEYQKLNIIGLEKGTAGMYFYHDTKISSDPQKNKVNAKVSKDPALDGLINAGTYKGEIIVKVDNYKQKVLPYTLVISPAKAVVNYDNIATQLDGKDYSKFDFSTLKAQYKTNGEMVDCDVIIMKLEGEEEIVATLNEDGTLPAGKYRIYANADQNYVVRDFAAIEILGNGDQSTNNGINQKTIILIASSAGGAIVLIGLIVGIVIAVKKKKSSSF